MDNKRLGVVLESHALIAQMAFDGKWRSCASKNIHLVTILAFSRLIVLVVLVAFSQSRDCFSCQLNTPAALESFMEVKSNSCRLYICMHTSFLKNYFT